MRVLLVEDEKPLAAALGKIFEKNKILVDVVNDGIEGKLLSEHDVYDVIILDIMLPGMTGLEILRSIREAGKNVPILLLTAKDDTKDKVNGLNMGADDYLVKPFEFAELLARLRALGRRSTQKIQQDVIEVGEFRLNRTAKVLKKKDQVIQLSPREFQIFDLLAQNIGIVVPRDIILDRIWGLESDVSSNNIDSYMKILRKKLDIGDGETIIKTVRGVGYKLEAGK